MNPDVEGCFRSHGDYQQGRLTLPHVLDTFITHMGGDVGSVSYMLRVNGFTDVIRLTLMLQGEIMDNDKIQLSV